MFGYFWIFFFPCSVSTSINKLKGFLTPSSHSNAFPFGGWGAPVAQRAPLYLCPSLGHHLWGAGLPRTCPAHFIKYILGVWTRGSWVPLGCSSPPPPPQSLSQLHVHVLPRGVVLGSLRTPPTPPEVCEIFWSQPKTLWGGGCGVDRGSATLGQLCPRLFFDLPHQLSYDLTCLVKRNPPPTCSLIGFWLFHHSLGSLQPCQISEALAPRRRNEAAKKGAKIRITALTNPQQAAEAPRLEEPCHFSIAKISLNLPTQNKP